MKESVERNPHKMINYENATIEKRACDGNIFPKNGITILEQFQIKLQWVVINQGLRLYVCVSDSTQFPHFSLILIISQVLSSNIKPIFTAFL